MVQAMSQEQFSALMGELVNIARGSQAAVQASAEVVTRIGQMNLGQAQSSDGYRGLEAASRILKNPEYFQCGCMQF